MVKIKLIILIHSDKKRLQNDCLEFMKYTLDKYHRSHVWIQFLLYQIHCQVPDFESWKPHRKSDLRQQCSLNLYSFWFSDWCLLLWESVWQMNKCFFYLRQMKFWRGFLSVFKTFLPSCKGKSITFGLESRHIRVTHLVKGLHT